MSASRWLHQLRRLGSVVEGSGKSGAVTGRFQTWRPPVYSAPHINPLEVGPDFSHADGRPIYVTSRVQLEYKQDQIRLAKKIVKLLDDVKHMEGAHQKAEKERKAKAARVESLRPKAKGTQAIV
ncbi:hypothetical protein Q1695_009858 [Nippostrongylus brasiliensis]|nr:hypothetical protein Q1695_009858 [Nippostrongylus brasiliensis]